MSDEPICGRVYDDIADAEADYEAMSTCRAAEAIGTYVDSAVIRKEEDGKVARHEAEKPTQHGAWTGAAVGALVGIVLPARDSWQHDEQCRGGQP